MIMSPITQNGLDLPRWVEGSPQPQLWTYQPGNGRVLVSIPGHYSWTFDDPIFRTLLLRGMAWVADEPIDRFNVLVTLGARISNSRKGAKECSRSCERSWLRSGLGEGNKLDGERLS